MNESIFSKVFSYRQKENHNPLENFLTEILSFCIENDINFRKDFLKKILKIKLDDAVFNISTQEHYLDYGRPDIEITNGNTIILLECKVEANERENQLEDYASILIKQKNRFVNKHIVFLTKYYEHKAILDKSVTLSLIRWFEIYELIKHNHNHITHQLKFFLKEQNMEKVKNFNVQDLLAMKVIPETMTKMDELLEQFKPEFERKFGGYSKDSSRSTRLPNNCYINYVSLVYEKQYYHLNIGFFWWWEDEVPYVGLVLEIPKKKFESSSLIDILDKGLLNKTAWEFEEDDFRFNYMAVKPVTDFITQQEDNLPLMKKYIELNLKTLIDLKAKYPKILKK
jgi:hypothetical protein